MDSCEDLMRTALHFNGVRSSWRRFCESLTTNNEIPSCIHLQRTWHRLCRKPRGTLVLGSRYCSENCLERALDDALQRVRSSSQPLRASHRIPLGLLLLSRQQLTIEQLRKALESQRAAGRGKIGEWLQALGFVNEQQVTAALARQWSCPVLRTNSLSSPGRIPKIPAKLLESFLMMPVDYVHATSTLHVAFAHGIDYSVLYAIEQMAGCRTEPCMASASLVRERLRTMSENRTETEVVFDRVADDAEFSRIIRSYSIRVAATEIRLAACSPHLWVRLLRSALPPLDLLLHSA
jgi:hypothetical protein